jgi:hypothetical protein
VELVPEVEPEVPLLVEAPPLALLRRLEAFVPWSVDDVDPAVAPVLPVPVEEELVDWANAGAASSRAAAARVVVESFTTRLLDCQCGS